MDCFDYLRLVESLGMWDVCELNLLVPACQDKAAGLLPAAGLWDNRVPKVAMCSRRCNSNADGRRYQEGTWETQGHLCGLPWSGGVSRSGPSPGEAVSANVMPASKGALGMLAMSGLSLLLSSLFRQSETASLAFAELPEPTTMHKKVTRVPHHYCGRLFL